MPKRDLFSYVAFSFSFFNTCSMDSINMKAQHTGSMNEDQQLAIVHF